MAHSSPPAPLRPPFPAFEAVIWDYDGTLVATRFADEQAVAEIVGADISTAAGAELFWATEGMPIQRRVELAWPGHSAEYLPLFERRVPPQPYDGVFQTLEELQRGGLRLGVVSSRQRDALSWGLEVTGLRRFFGPVIGLDDVRRPKPSPEGLQLALAALKVQPTKAVYVGDSEFDIEAATNAGMVGWRATWSTEVPSSSGMVLLQRPQDVLTHLAQGEAGATRPAGEWLRQAAKRRPRHPAADAGQAS